MPVVSPEFGPTLPQLLAPYVRRLPRPVRVAGAVLGGALVLLIAWALLRGDAAPGQRTVVVRGTQPFNFIYRAPFTRQAPHAGELARVGHRGQSFTVRPLHLPAYRGDASAFLALYAGQLEERLGRQLPGYATRGDGRANINKIQGYEINYHYRPGGKLTFGRLIFLLPTVTARDGVEISVRAPADKAIVNADAVGRNGPLKTSLRSFRFGTERP
jgi:hypothetical protein